MARWAWMILVTVRILRVVTVHLLTSAVKRVGESLEVLFLYAIMTEATN